MTSASSKLYEERVQQPRKVALRDSNVLASGKMRTVTALCLGTASAFMATSAHKPKLAARKATETLPEGEFEAAQPNKSQTQIVKTNTSVRERAQRQIVRCYQIDILARVGLR